MKEMSLNEIKNEGVKMLLNFDEFCKNNKIHYSLAEGTLIGAVRHKGYIPWDDDIDVIMLRKDFDRFKSCYTDKRYSIIQPSKDSTFPYFYIRLSDNKTCVQLKDNIDYYKGGIWIDIFPIDNFPDDDKDLSIYERKLWILFKIYRAKTKKWWWKEAGLFYNIIWIIIKMGFITFPYRMLSNIIEKELTKYNGKTSKRKGFLTNYWHHPWIFPSEVFDSFTELEFEGHRFSVIHGYDDYLRCEYGDYMKLPPEKDRQPSHDYRAYWKSDI